MKLISALTLVTAALGAGQSIVFAGPNVWTSLRVRSLAIDRQNSEYANYDPAGARFFKAMDGGANWKEAGFGLQGNFVASLAVDPQNAIIPVRGIQGYNASGWAYRAYLRTQMQQQMEPSCPPDCKTRLLFMRWQSTRVTQPSFTRQP